MSTIQIVAVISPFVSAFLTAILTYKFTTRSKRLDILYQNRVSAFKEIAANIISFKNFCEGRVAYFQANEFSPFYNDSPGTLEHRIKIASSLEANIVFVSKDSRILISDFLSQMSGLCNAELSIAGGNHDIQPMFEYQRISALAENAIEILYNELNLPKS